MGISIHENGGSIQKDLVSNDESKAVEKEAFIRSIEDEKIDLEKKWQPCLRNSHQIRIGFS